MHVGTRFPVPGLAGVCAAILPPEAGGPEPRALARRIEGYVAHLPAPTRHALRAGVALLNAVAVGTSGKTLLRHGPEARERVLGRLLARPETRQGLEGMKALVLMAAGSQRFGPELLRRWQAVEPVRPDPELDVVPAAWWPSRSRHDAVVVGSGAGGAFAARVLARAGLDVVVVEEGRRFSVADFRERDPLERFAELYRDGGTTVALGRPPIVLPVGRGVGGTTLVNSGTCYRPPRPVLLRWRDECGLTLADPDAFAPFLDDVWETLAVSPVPAEVMGRNGELVLTGAKSLGWRCGPLMHNGAPCRGCCQSAIGCPVNAKYGVHLNALPDACRAGARIVSEARVERILHEGGRAYGVLVRRPDGTTLVVSAPRVIVAAGATETPPLLRRSGLGQHPELGRNLAIHPAVGVLGRFEEAVTPWEGVLQSAGVEEFHEREGILIEATAAPPGMGSVTVPGYGRRLVEGLEGADHLVSVGAMVGDAPVGRVDGSRRTVVRYDLAEHDGRRLLRAVEVMGRILLAAGATDVYPGLPGHTSVRDEAELEAAVAAASPRALHLAAFHPTGSARAGADPERFPVDERGRLRGVEGVWVTDASAVPTCPEVNPQVSVMALAAAFATGVATGTAPA